MIQSLRNSVSMVLISTGVLSLIGVLALVILKVIEVALRVEYVSWDMSVELVLVLIVLAIIFHVIGYYIRPE